MEKEYEYEYIFKKYLFSQEGGGKRDNTINYLELYITATDKVSRKAIDVFFKECFEDYVFRYLGHEITDEGTVLLSKLLDKLFKTEFLDKYSKGAYVKLTWKGSTDSFSTNRKLTKKESFLRNSY